MGDVVVLVVCDLGPLSLLLLCVYITTSVLPQTSAVTVVRNNTYYLVLHLQKQLDTHKLFVFVLIITNVVLSLVSLIKS